MMKVGILVGKAILNLFFALGYDYACLICCSFHMVLTMLLLSSYNTIFSELSHAGRLLCFFFLLKTQALSTL